MTDPNENLLQPDERQWVRVEDIKKLIDEINRQYSWQSEATRALGDLRRKLLAPPSEGRKDESLSMQKRKHVQSGKSLSTFKSEGNQPAEGVIKRATEQSVSVRATGGPVPR